MNKMTFNGLMAVSLILAFSNSSAISGVLDPDCDTGDVAKKATKKALD